MKTPKKLTGKRFGKLTVVSLSDKKAKGCVIWNCLCDCGNICEKKSIKLMFGSTISCGCMRGKTVFTHDKSHTTEYRIWTNIKTRCYNSKNRFYHRYGGRGITMCDRWRDSFTNFLEDVGYRPSKSVSLDRIDNDGNYEPGNIKWSTQKEQCNNRIGNVVLMINGVNRPLVDVARENGLQYNTLRKRLSAGWSSEDLLLPIRKADKGMI